MCIMRDGLYCSGLSDTDPTVAGTCQAVPKLGEPCPERACELGTFCDPTTELCRPHLEAGEACLDSYDCRPLDCVNGVCAPRQFLDYECLYELRQ